ncbi:hypothetical protein Tco_0194302 [Tanacetum coccineum]
MRREASRSFRGSWVDSNMKENIRSYNRSMMRRWDRRIYVAVNCYVTMEVGLEYLDLLNDVGVADVFDVGCKTSSEVEPNLETLPLTTLTDIQAYLLSEDELTQESDEEEVFATKDNMDEDTQADKEKHQSPPNSYKTEPSPS